MEWITGGCRLDAQAQYTHGRPRETRRRCVAVLLLAAAAFVPIGAAPSSQPLSSRTGPPLFEGYRAEGYPAISAPSQTITLAFVHSGALDRVPVVESQLVAPGDVIAQLDDRVQRFTVAAQGLAAEDQSAIEAARRRAELAKYDLENVKEMRGKGAAAPRELERAQAETALREIDISAAQRDREQARILLDRESATLNQMTLRSPIHGIVARVAVEQGETIEALQPVAHIVAIDPLWLDVAVPVRLGLMTETGSVAVVRWRDVPGDVPVEGRVLWVSPVADASASSIVIRLEVDNPQRLPAGLHALVQFPEAEDALRRSLP